MDPGGSELDSSLPQPETPCLIVEDSQPDSGALEDDPESSYRALLARRLSSLQPTARSPVLELISSPIGSRSSQTDSQSEDSQINNQAEPGVMAASDPRSTYQEESQVIKICAPQNQHRCAEEEADLESGADSTTHCVQSEEGASQAVFLQLSQSQDVGGDAANSQEDNGVNQTERLSSSDHQLSSRTSENQDPRAVRSEVSSSSSLGSQQSRKLSVQVLLHSQGLQDQQDSEILSSQQDLFDADKTGVAVDSTVSEPEQQGAPTPTPARTLSLLQLSGQGTLVQQSLSQSSVDFVAPTPDHFSHTPLIVPSSPTEHPADEPMDTSAAPQGPAVEKDEPMDTEVAPKPRPSSSTPISQNSPGFVLERTLSIPSQPEFSHDAFVPTQSQEAPPRVHKRVESPSEQVEKRVESPSERLDSAPVSLHLSVNSQSCELQQDDSQDTQIDMLTAPPASNCEKGRKTSEGVAVEPQTASRTSSTSSQEKKPGVDQPDSLSTKKTNSQTTSQPCDITANSCVEDTPSDSAPSRLTHQTPVDMVKSPIHLRGNSQSQIVREEEEVEEESAGGGASAMALVLSQSQMVSPEPIEKEEEEEEEQHSVIVVSDSDRDSQTNHSKVGSSQPVRGSVSVSTNGHPNRPSDRLSQPERAGPETEALKDKSLSDSSGEILFHFTLPKDGELIGPAVGATPPLISQLKQTLRHSTPIEISSLSEKSANVSADGEMAASDITAGESVEDMREMREEKLSLRMKLVTPVEEGSSERFSLQKPVLSEEHDSLKVSSVHQAVNSPSVFSRVRQVHREQDAQEERDSAGNGSPVRAELFSSPQRSSQASSLGCNSLRNSQSEQPSQQEVTSAPKQTAKDPPTPTDPPKGRTEDPQTPTRIRGSNTISSTAHYSPTSKVCQRTVSQQTGMDSVPLRSPAGRGEPASPSSKRTTGPAHRRHVRTIQEVRTTVTRIITDVYYEDGKEVERKVTQESEEPVVDCQVLDSDISPCRTGSSSVTSGDLGDISSLSSKASSLQQSSGGTSSSGGFIRNEFLLPPSRVGGANSPQRGGGHQQRGHRVGSVLTADRGSPKPRPLPPLTPRGRARRGRPPSRLCPSRGGGISSVHRLGALPQPLSSSEDEPFTRMLPPRLPVSPSDPSPSRSDSLRSSPEEASSVGSSFVGLRVVAKWSSNGYFYSGRIIKDAGDAKFRLRFDDGYECEVAAKDILLCDPIPVETEVTALLEDQFFSVGVVKGHRLEGAELQYSVERDGQSQWFSRTSIILSLDQGNKLREHHSLGPYEPHTPLTKGSDISLDNLVEGKRRRRGAPGGETTPHRRSSSSPRTPGPSGKRKLMTSEDGRSPSKRGRRGGGARAAQRTGVCNTSGSGTDLAGRSSDDVRETHGPLPVNSSLFLGFAFMLTASSESDRLTNRLSGEDQDDFVQTAPYNKAYTESQLQAGGGFILPDFNEEQCKAAYQSLLIADQHCRTRKYLLCLGSGVPCVSNMWVRDCCKDNKLLNYRNYLLPAGAGPDDAIVEWHPRCSPFSALRVLLIFQQPQELWAQLISLGGGTSVRHAHTEEGGEDLPVGKFDVAVTDAACPPLVQKKVTSQEMPLVSPEWIIQSIIRGEKLGYHSNPQYRHDFSSS